MIKIFELAIKNFGDRQNIFCCDHARIFFPICGKTIAVARQFFVGTAHCFPTRTNMASHMITIEEMLFSPLKNHVNECYNIRNILYIKVTLLESLFLLLTKTRTMTQIESLYRIYPTILPNSHLG